MDGLGGDRDQQLHHDRPPSVAGDDVTGNSFGAADDRGIRSPSTGSSINTNRLSDDREGFRDDALSPPPLSSPSIASSLGFSNSAPSALPGALSQDTLHDNTDGANVTSRHDLAWRLTRLAQQLADGDDVDDGALNAQVERMENTFIHTRQPRKQSQPTPVSVGTHARRGQDTLPGSYDVPSPLRARVSELSPPLPGDANAETNDDEGLALPIKDMTAKQVKKVVAEAMKLNDELATVVTNLKARQEESDHIHGLLIERAERAAQRIIFLQNRISYLESELQENDEELQHLRICLKAVEIQMPPHPDEDLQRCITTFKDDFQDLKKKRASRVSLAGLGSLDSTQVDGSPTR